METIRIPYETMEETIYKLFTRRGAPEEPARIAAKNFTDNSAYGMPSHGMNRVARMAELIDLGDLNPAAQAELVSREGARAILHGNFGFGNVNAYSAMDLACDMAAENGIGIAVIHHTNHWLRGGAYGWQAANRGFAAICWSNTCPNMVPWGGEASVLGNNPLVLAAPRENGRHVVWDSAMSQFSYGALQNAASAGEKMPFHAGWDAQGELTDDPDAVLKSGKALPMGYWKGSGLSLLLDLLGALAGGGDTVSEIGRKYTSETGLTQVMIAIKPAIAGAVAGDKIDGVLGDLARSAGESGEARYPGQREYREHQQSMAEGVRVDKAVWEGILAL